MENETKILADSWYADYLTGNITTVQKYLDTRFNKWILKLSGIRIIRGLLLLVAVRKFDLFVTPLGRTGVSTFIILQGIWAKKKRKVVLLEFFRPLPLSPLKKAIWPVWTKRIFGKNLSEVLLKAQVLTSDEIKKYSALFGVPEHRFTYIPWPLRNKGLSNAVTMSGQSELVNGITNYVMTSGMANVDWETIFQVAEKSNWSFLAVCNRANLRRVNRLNKNQRAVVLCDISQEEHARYVKGATVYALCVNETFTSVGQIRLMNAIELGVPVVASDVCGLQGYIRNGINCITAPPGNVMAIKAVIDQLMNDPALRSKLTTTARAYQSERTMEEYITQIIEYVKAAIPDENKNHRIKPAA